MPNSSAPPRFSLKELLLALAAVSGVLGIGIAYGFGPASALALVASGWMTRVGLREKRHLLIATGFPLVFASAGGVFLALALWLLLGVGPVFLPQFYPAEVTRMINTAEGSAWGTKVYGLGDFLDKEFVWRMRLTQKQLDRLLAAEEFLNVRPESVPAEFFRKFPRRWRPRQDAASQFYCSPDFPERGRGPDGRHCFMMYDPNDGKLYVWYKDNF